MTTKQVLEAARKLIADPRRWCQGSLDDEAGRVCAVGAIASVTCGTHQMSEATIGDNPELSSGMEALCDVLTTPGRLGAMGAGREIARYNDSHDHKCVLAAFDAAIERAS